MRSPPQPAVYIQPLHNDPIGARYICGIKLKRCYAIFIGNDIRRPMDGGTEILHAGQRVCRGAVVGRIKLAHFVISLRAMGNDTRGIEVAAIPFTITPLGGDNEHTPARSEEHTSELQSR